MRTTLAWLKTHLETEAPLPVIVERLIMLGHDIEQVESRAAGLEAFTVASVYCLLFWRGPRRAARNNAPPGVPRLVSRQRA